MARQLPKNAKRVFKGIIFDAYQWRQRLFDGSYSTFELITRQNTVEVIATIKDKLVVCRQRQPGHPWYYSLPGGRMDKLGETPRKTALRELREETGLVPQRLDFWKKINNESKIVHQGYFFIAKNCYQKYEPQLDKGEQIKIELHSFKSFLSLTDRSNCFFGSSTFMNELLRARLHPAQRKALAKQVFG